MSFATVADVQARYPDDAAQLCAGAETRLPDWERFTAALADVSTEIRIILQGRYTRAELDDLDAESLGALRLFAIDMAMYRVAVTFARTTEELKTRYTLAVQRLEGIAKGRGALTFNSSHGGGEDVSDSPGGVDLVAPERVFSRDTWGAR